MHDEDPERENDVPSEGQVSDKRVATLSSRVASVIEDSDSSDADVLVLLNEMAWLYSVDEVLAIALRFDTPDVLG